MKLNPNQLTVSGIKEVLKESSLIPRADSSKGDLSVLLEEAKLSPAEILSQVGELMHYGETGAIKARAAEIGLKLNGMLSSDDGIRIPIVNIIIRDSQYTEINPILIPR